MGSMTLLGACLNQISGSEGGLLVSCNFFADMKLSFILVSQLNFA